MIKQYKTSPRFSILFRASELTAIVALVFMLCFTSGCTSFDYPKVLKINPDLIQFSYKIADNLTKRALPPLMPRNPEMPILVTTFVNNNDLQETSSLGRVLQEQITSRLVQLGYTVREIKLANTLHIAPKSGETILSRDLAQISGEQEAQAILTGTISRTNEIVYISARLITPTNNNILASDDSQLFVDDDILAMLGLQYQNDSDAPVAEPQPPFLNSIL